MLNRSKRKMIRENANMPITITFLNYRVLMPQLLNLGLKIPVEHAFFPKLSLSLIKRCNLTFHLPRVSLPEKLNSCFLHVHCVCVCEFLFFLCMLCMCARVFLI